MELPYITKKELEDIIQAFNIYKSTPLAKERKKNIEKLIIIFKNQIKKEYKK